MDVKRCHALRPALQLLDFDDASIEGVQGLLLRAAMLPAFLRLAEGRRFVAYLFNLHVRGERETVTCMCAQGRMLLSLPTCKRLLWGADMQDAGCVISACQRDKALNWFSVHAV